MPDDSVSNASSARKSALLLLLNLCLLGLLFWASYVGELAMIWQADVLKLSFVIVGLYFVTAFALTFDLVSDDLAEEIESRLPMIALCGTVYGILTVFQVLATAKVGTASDFKAMIGPLLAGGGTAMWPTFLGLLGSNLLWVHLVVRRMGEKREPRQLHRSRAQPVEIVFGDDDEEW